MKKNVIKSFSAFMLALTMAACSNSNEGESAVSSGEETENTTVSASGVENIGLYGEVSEIIGNEVMLKLIEMPERPAGNGENDGNGGGRGSGGGGRSGDGGSGAVREKKYTGDEKTIVIPVGIPLVTATRGEAGSMEENEISMNEVTPGSILSVYYKEDGETFEKIRVQKPRTGGGQGGRGGN